MFLGFTIYTACICETTVCSSPHGNTCIATWRAGYVLYRVLLSMVCIHSMVFLSVFRYHESMLDCCASLEVVKQKGITFKEFTCLARCSGLDVQMFQLTGHVTQQYFRELVRSLTTTDDRVIVMSYSRKTLKQTGDGHFAPIGGYHPQRDLILVMDVARFKYPPHWVSMSTLWEAMNTSDSETGRLAHTMLSVVYHTRELAYTLTKSA